MKIKQWLQKNKNRISGMTKAQIVKLGEAETGKSARCFYMHLRNGAAKITKMGTISDFKKMFDPKAKIKEVLDSMPDDAYITNKEMSKSCNIGANELKENREYFLKNILNVGDCLYWAKPCMINKMKKVLQS